MCNVAHSTFVALLGFPPMDKNLHDIRPHLTAHLPVCAKTKGERTWGFRSRRSTKSLASSSTCPNSSSTSSKPTLPTWTIVASRSTISVVQSRTIGSIRSTTLDGVHRTIVSTRSAKFGPCTPLVGFLHFPCAVFDQMLVLFASRVICPRLSCRGCFLDSALSCPELRRRSSPCSSIGPYTATSHVSYSPALHVPPRQGTFLLGMRPSMRKITKHSV